MDSASSDGSGGGDSAKIEGMGQPDEFPKDSATELRDAAEIVGGSLVAMVEMLIQKIKDLLGDHTAARDLALTWGTSTTIADVKRDLAPAELSGAVADSDSWDVQPT